MGIETNNNKLEKKETQTDALTKLVDDVLGKTDAVQKRLEQQPGWEAELREQLDAQFNKDTLQDAKNTALESEKAETHLAFADLQQSILKEVPEAKNVGNA